VPTVIEELRDHRVRQVVAGFYHCAALTEDGALFTWETDRENCLGPDRISELGYGNHIHEAGVPCRVSGLKGERIDSVAVGNHFTVAVTEAGLVYSFGRGDGRIGHGGRELEEVYLPKRIDALNGVHVVSVAAGSWHALALTRCGRVHSWGDNEEGNLELGRENSSHGVNDLDHSIPLVVTALVGERVRAIAAGPSMSCAVTDAGALFTWGRNRFGNLGHGDVQ
jgi:E3 ubiquitin-protein ligase HERC4